MKAVILVFCLSLFSRDAIAQWSHLETFDNRLVWSIHFLDYLGKPRVGFLTTGRGLTEAHIWRTEDGGDTWQQVAFTDRHAMNGLTFKNDKVGWAAGAWVWCVGLIYKTVDGGLSWHVVDTSCSVDIHYDRTHDMLVAVGGETDGITISKDLGTTWQSILPGSYDHVVSDSNGTFIASGRAEQLNANNFSYSSDGIDWKISDLRGGTAEMAVRGNSVFAMLSWGKNAGRLVRSTNSGRNWNEVVKFTDNLEFNSGVLGSNSCYLYAQSFRHFYKSRDEGRTWEIIGDIGNGPGVRFCVTENVIYATTHENSTSDLWRYVEPVELTLHDLDLAGCSVDTSVTLSYNADCFKGELLSATIEQSGDQFSIGSLNLPANVAGEFKIPISYEATTDGIDQAKLKLRFKAGSYEFDTIVALQGQGRTIPQGVSFVAKASTASPFSNERTTLSIFPSVSASNVDLHEINFDLSFVDDLFRFEAVKSSEQSSVGVATVNAGRIRVPITITGSNITLDPDVPIAEIELMAMLTDTTMTDVTISNVKLNGGDQDYARCKLALSESEGTALTVQLQCGDPLMQRVIRGEKALEIKSVTPNPTQDKVTLEWEARVAGDVKLEVYSIAGVLVHEEGLPAKASATTLDTRAWPSGAYSIVLRSGDEEARGSVIKQ